MAEAVDIVRTPTNLAEERRTAIDVTSDTVDRVVTVRWADGHVSRFPFIWLRHEFFLPSRGRPEQIGDSDTILPEEPMGVTLGSLTLEGENLVIDWVHDGRQSVHSLAWLRENCLSDDARRARRPLPTHWTGEDAVRFRRFPVETLEVEEGRLEIFDHVREFGIALIKDVPMEPGTLVDLARHFGPIRRTHFGSLFDIRSLPVDRLDTGANIGATAANALAPHTDEGWRHAPPGITLFHCLKADPSGGGASTFVDGIAAAETLRQRNPEAFDLLIRTPLLFKAERNSQERFRARGRVIATDTDGVVRGIRITDRTLPPLDLPEDKIEPAYRALAAFYEILYTRDRALERCLTPREMVVFDNHRVLHARNAFDRQAGERHIQQLSIDREEWHNTFRQLAESLGRYDLVNWEPDAGALAQS